MKPEAQRIAIAEACGWHSFRDIGGDSETKLWGHDASMKRTSLPTQLVPDYLTDLNAMHEAEMALHDSSPGLDEKGNPLKSDRQRFRENLCVVCAMNGGPIHATAAQRAEAFLRTIGKWEATTTTPKL